MKSLLSGFSYPSATNFAKLWKEGLFVLDTNALLDLYRLPTGARNDVISVLKVMGNQLWLPHQVCLEFERNRLSVISTQRKNLEKLRLSVELLHSQLRNDILKVELGQRTAIDVDSFVAESRKLYAKLEINIDKALLDQPQVDIDDSLRESIVDIFEGKTGARPTQSELDDIFSEGRRRFELRQPPGFLDIGKAKNPLEAKYVADGLTYEAQYGDLVMWKQLLKHAKLTKQKGIALITSERSDDWWYKFEGKTMGPQPELISEMMREANVEVFWMYDVQNFLQQSKILRHTSVKDESIQEVKESLRISGSELVRLVDDESLSLANSFRVEGDIGSLTDIDDTFNPRLDVAATGAIAEACVYDWLSEKYPEQKIHRDQDFPDFVVKRDDLLGQKYGFDVTLLGAKALNVWSRRIEESFMRGVHEIRQNRLDLFTSVIVLDQPIRNALLFLHLDQKIMAVEDKFGFRNVVLGVQDRGRFVQIDRNELRLSIFPGSRN